MCASRTADQFGDLPDAILLGKKKVLGRVPSLGPCPPAPSHTSRPIRDRGGQSKNVQLTGTSLRPVKRRTAATPTSRRRAAVSALHAHPVAAPGRHSSGTVGREAMLR
jgi:hypothetical protein